MKVYKGEKEDKAVLLPTTLDDLDALPTGDPRRDDVCKRLSPEDQVRLMKRYGYEWRSC